MDRQVAYVTAEDLLLIQAQWAVIDGSYESFASEQALVAALRIELGREPTDQELDVARAGRELAKGEAAGDPGTQRDALVELAEHSIAADEPEDALALLLKAFVLDVEAERGWHDGSIAWWSPSQALPGRLVGVMHMLSLDPGEVVSEVLASTEFEAASRGDLANRLGDLLASYVASEVPGYVDGLHYTEHVETVKELKRSGDLAAAERLLLRLIDATEAESRQEDSGVAPWYYQQVAIIRAKLQDLPGEVEVLERYAAQPHAPGSMPPKLMERLEKTRRRLLNAQG